MELAPKEYDLLLALFDRDGAVVSRLDLMRRVWGYSDAVVTRMQATLDLLQEERRLPVIG